MISQRASVDAVPSGQHASERLYPNPNEAMLSRAICNAKLVLRSSCSLDSKRVGDLLRGVEVLMLEQVQTDNGDVRARVGRDSTPRGLCAVPMGWVTAKKAGDLKLEPRPEQKAHAILSMDSMVRDVLEERRALRQSMASRIAQHRRERPRPRQTLSEAETTGGASSEGIAMAGAVPNNNSNSEGLAPTSEDAANVIDGAARSPSRPGQASPPAARKAEPTPLASTNGAQLPAASLPRAGGGGANTGKAAAATNKEKLDLSTAAIEELAVAQEALAKQAEEAAAALPTLSSKMGQLIAQRMSDGLKTKQFFELLDKNGDQKVSKMEWRQTLRGLGMNDDVRDLDALFVHIDADGSEFVTFDELTTALKQLKLQAAATAAEMQRLKERAAGFHANSRAIRDAAGPLAAWESATAELEQVRKNPSAELRLGRKVVQRGLRVHDIVAKFPEDAEITDANFARVMQEIGVQASTEELYALFQIFDSDGSGSLDHKELAEALRRLSDVLLKARNDEAQMMHDIEKKRRKAEEMQHNVRELLEWESRKRAGEEAAAAAAAAAEVAVREEKRELLRQQQEKKRLAEEMKKAEWEERVAQKLAQKRKEAIL